MDYLILYCALKLLEIAAPLLRIAIAALLSSFCAICLLQMHLSLLFVLILRLLLFVLTTAFVVPPKNAELYFRYSITVWGLAVVCGGISLCVVFLQNGSVYTNKGQMLLLHLPAYLWPVGACGLILFVSSIRKWISDLQIKQNTAEVRIEVSGQSFFCQGYYDTGHLQSDPISGRSIIVACAEIFSPWINCEPHFCAMSFLEHVQDTALAQRVSLICVKTVSGDGMLACFRPDNVYVDGVSMHALIALFPSALDPQNRFQALLPINMKKKG